MPYDFSRFSPQSFERLIQALALAVSGPRLQIFGAGRDGAREATYEGHLALGAAAWDGYTVFQAKHRLFPGQPAKDADWLIGELDGELDKFADPKRNLRRPDFYVLASNVRLSASAADAVGKGEGGIDKVMRHLKDKANQIGIKDVCLWHADTLSSLLDNHPGVRQSYDFWVQPGDALAALLREMEGPGEEEVLIPFLRRGLKEAREIKTKDIGQAIGRTVMLEEVFVDLPIDRQAQTFLAFEFEFEGAARPMAVDHVDRTEDVSFDDEFDDVFAGPSIVAELMRRAANKFEPQNDTIEQNKRGKGERCPGETQNNRIVLLGGPGQGKSTVGQFVAQLCRARLLDTLQIAQAPETNKTVEAILSCARMEQIPLIGPPRYPFHIELPRYADALSTASREDRGLSILAHVALEISRSGDSAVSAAKLREWIGKLPTIVILDGLDEVPRSGNREAVVNAIEDLLDTIHEANGDCLVFCTSRQQGYQRELDPNYWAHWFLESLSAEAALRLARGVSNILVSENSRREEILATLAEAAEDATTAPLMISPLQVMLLFQLVSTHNNIPKDRWTLFQRHYETLRDREITKGGAMGRTISKHRSQIDSIHRDAGYLLHLRAEQAGGAEAYLTDAEFEALVYAQLVIDGFEDEAAELAPEIARLATNRLVFLRSQVGGQVAFDVRSLQEFMAAARLTASPEDRIRDRLECIAGRSHWLHVFKIACSKIYGSNAHEALRTPLIALLDSLDAGDRCSDDRLLRVGARLALQLLTDGSAQGVPVYRRQLLVRALRLANQRDVALLWELARVIDFREKNHLEPLLLEMLGGADHETRLQILRLLAYASRNSSPEGSAWATATLEQHWPESPADVLTLFDLSTLLPENPAIASRLRAAQWALPVLQVAKWTADLIEDQDEEGPSIPEGLMICRGRPDTKAAPLLLPDKSVSNLIVAYRSLSSSVRLNAKPEAGAHGSWRVADAAADFADDPSLETAKAFLEAFAKHSSPDEKGGLLPWPLRGLIIYAKKRGGIPAAIAALDGGKLGDIALWRTAEAQWRDEGITITGLANMQAGDAMALEWHGHTAPMPGGIRPGSKTGSLPIPLLELIEDLPLEPWPLNALLLSIARGDHPLGDMLHCFLNSFDPSTRAGRIAWRSYVNALVVAYVEKPADQMFERILAALPRAARLLPDLSGLEDALVAGFVRDESQRHILSALISNLRGRVDEKLLELPPSAYSICENDTEEVRAAVTVLRIVAGKDNATEPEAIQALIAAPPRMFSTFLRHLTRSRSEQHRAVALAICRAALTSNAADRFHFQELLVGMVEAIPVELSNSKQAKRLDLPSPLEGRS